MGNGWRNSFASFRHCGEQGLFGRTLLVDCGLSEEGRRLAEALARERRWVVLCGKDEVGSYLPGRDP